MIDNCLFETRNAALESKIFRNFQTKKRADKSESGSSLTIILIEMEREREKREKKEKGENFSSPEIFSTRGL